jgi:hypothetical protein
MLSGSAPSFADWGEIYNDEESVNLNGAIQTTGQTGNRLTVTLTWLNASDERLAIASNYRALLFGKRHRLTIVPTDLGHTQRGVGGGSPLLVGAHSVGATQLSFDGASGGSVTDYLKQGDYVSVGNELKKVRIDVDTTTNAGTIEIFPELHGAHANNAPINITTPAGVFYLNNSPTDQTNHAGIAPRIVLEMISDVLA